VPAAAPGNAAQEAAGRSTFSEDSFKVVERIAFVGPSLVYIIKRWGLPGLCLFAAGAAFPVLLVALGVYPSALVSASYKQSAPAAATPARAAERTQLRSISFESLGKTEEWIQPYADLFERQGFETRDTYKEKGEDDTGEESPGGAAGEESSYHFIIDILGYNVEQPVNKFTLLLKPTPDFGITVRAFRQTGGLVQPLEFKQVGQELSFSIPACEPGDTIILVVRSHWMRDIKVKGVKDTFSPSVQSEGL
jgi:hypothetical protein